MQHTSHPLYTEYTRLWETALPRIERGDLQIDHEAEQQANDPRRGMTLIGRLAPGVVAAIQALLAELNAAEPGQYLYPPGDIHVTVLSLFTAHSGYQSMLARQPEFLAAVARVLANTPAFTLDTVGLTASPGAVMVQSFPRDDTLAGIRERLRAELIANRLDALLDTRYRLITAHTTMLRFTAPLHDPVRFAALLRHNRERSFGTTHCTELTTVLNNWYMSSEWLRVLARHPLER